MLARARENGVPIGDANVGVTRIVSKGEVVACERRVDAVTVATIVIPASAVDRQPRPAGAEVPALAGRGDGAPL